MNAKNKKVLFIFGAGAAAAVLTVLIFILTFDINSYMPRIEAVASRTTGLEVRINGKMGISFFPFGISAKDIRVASKGSEILSLESLNVGVEFMPLLKKQIKVTMLELVKPSFNIEKNAKGIYNFDVTEKRSTEVRPRAAFSLNELKLSKGRLIYIDKKTGEKTEFEDFNLTIKDILIADTSRDIVRNALFTGSLVCKEVRKKALKIENIKSSIKAEKGVIHLTPLSVDIFGAKAEGDITVDKSEADAMYKINFNVSKLDFEKLQESSGAKKVVGGKGNINASLTMKEKGNRNLMSSMDGTFSLSGTNLIIYTMDIDKVLSSYETSQKFNLVDIGAFFIAGPLSTGVLKGYRYGDLYNQTRGGQGTITQNTDRLQLEDQKRGCRRHRLRPCDAT
jgi:AsmA protein